MLISCLVHDLNEIILNSTELKSHCKIISGVRELSGQHVVRRRRRQRQRRVSAVEVVLPRRRRLPQPADTAAGDAVRLQARQGPDPLRRHEVPHGLPAPVPLVSSR